MHLHAARFAPHVAVASRGCRSEFQQGYLEHRGGSGGRGLITRLPQPMQVIGDALDLPDQVSDLWLPPHGRAARIGDQ